MKRLAGLMFAALVALVGLRSSAPAEAASGNSIKLGVNLANFSGDDVPGDADYRQGYVAGVAFSLHRSAQVEILYTQKGMYLEDDATGDEETWEFDYVQTALLLRAGRQVQVFGGPYVGVNLSATVSYVVGGSESSIDLRDDLPEDPVTSADIGFVGGLAFGSRSAKFEIRYEMGTEYVMDQDLPSSSDFKNECISAMFSMTF